MRRFESSRPSQASCVQPIRQRKPRVGRKSRHFVHSLLSLGSRFAEPEAEILERPCPRIFPFCGDYRRRLVRSPLPSEGGSAICALISFRRLLGEAGTLNYRFLPTRQIIACRPLTPRCVGGIEVAARYCNSNERCPCSTKQHNHSSDDRPIQYRGRYSRHIRGQALTKLASDRNKGATCLKPSSLQPSRRKTEALASFVSLFLR
jgi:hypothetical protein